MKKGISLYELLIVMAIIGIIAAIAIPSMRNYLPSMQLSSSTRAIVSKLRQAQEEAVTTQIRHGVHLITSTDPPTLDFIKVDPTEEILQSVTLDRNIILGIDPLIIENEYRIIFSADGGPDVYGNIVVNLDTASKTINISPAGVIKLQ